MNNMSQTISVPNAEEFKDEFRVIIYSLKCEAEKSNISADKINRLALAAQELYDTIDRKPVLYNNRMTHDDPVYGGLFKAMTCQPRHN
jgi:hypothetical protein